MARPITKSFQTETKQLLQLMIHSLYSNKEIFLRELVSNSSDALDKLRFNAIENSKLLDGDADLKIDISLNAKNNTVTISDNGIGMTEDEIINYKQYSPSGGLMLESFSLNLLEKGRAHYGAKTKNIIYRIETLNNAEKIKYPMTTGLLIGITESKDELINDIVELIQLCKKNTAIQEIILQNFRAKKNTLMRNNAEIINDLFLRIIATTRLLLPSQISLQVPPNLLPDVEMYLTSGINDLGGISPKTIDWVNPDHLWPDLNNLEKITSSSGQFLKKRLPVYPSFINNEWLSTPVFEKVSNVIDNNGYPKQ